MERLFFLGIFSRVKNYILLKGWGGFVLFLCCIGVEVRGGLIFMCN